MRESQPPRSITELPPEPGLDALRLRELVDEYRVALRVAGRSPRTIRWYGDHLAEFIRFLERSGDRATLAELRPPVVRRWLVEISARHDPPLAPSSVAGRVRTLHAFGSWLEREFDLPNNPLRGVPVPRVPEQLVRSLREPDIRALLAAIDAGSEQPDRDRALVLLLLDTGIRLSEAAGLSVHDIDLLEGRCRVMGKGAKERVVPVGRKARRAIRQMLARRGNAVASAPLFTGADGRPLAPHGLQQVIRRLSARATFRSIAHRTPCGTRLPARSCRTAAMCSACSGSSATAHRRCRSPAATSISSMTTCGRSTARRRQ